jgi:small GTP-binding protein
VTGWRLTIIEPISEKRGDLPYRSRQINRLKRFVSGVYRITEKVLFPMRPPPSHKVAFIGNASVGKTSIINVVTRTHTQDPTSPTVGAENSHYKITINNSEVDLNIWDTAGQEVYRALLPMYLRDAEVIVIVFALNDRTSFEALPDWAKEAKERAPEAIIVLVGNKSDKEGKERQVDAGEAEEARKTLQASCYWETSAVMSHPMCVTDFFADVARLAKGEDEAPPNKGVTLGGGVAESAGGCCG